MILRSRLTLLMLFISLTVLSKNSLAAMPVFSCEVLSSKGSFNSYASYEKGQRVTIDLNRLDQYQGMLKFENKGVYMSIPGELKIINMINDNGVDRDVEYAFIKLIADNLKDDRLTFEFINKPGMSEALRDYSLNIYQERRHYLEKEGPYYIESFMDLMCTSDR